MRNDYTVAFVCLFLMMLSRPDSTSGQPVISVDRAIKLSWSTKSNHLYQVESSPDPGSETWTPVNSTFRATSTNGSGVDLILEPESFYRVREYPTPTNMIWVEPGAFLMGGSPDDPNRFARETPQTVVRLTEGFYMGRFEVTQQEFQEVTGFNPSLFTGDPLRPVETVNWFNCTNYCYKRSNMEHAAGTLPKDYRYRLPTEAEWEYVCRAGTTTRYSFGDGFDLRELDAYAWHCRNECVQSHHVGRRLPNPWGFYDMHGNVWEYTADWYFESYAGGTVTNPTGAETGTLRVLRGGAWNRDPLDHRSSHRVRGGPEDAFSNIGFRVVLARVDE